MIEVKYWFLFVLALVWIVFATVHDLRKREVSNWLNFSLIAFALAYRAFYASAFNDWQFFVHGLIGFGVFFCLANLFYYSNLFAGGDAKLLMGLGAVLPFESLYDFAFIGGGFIILLLSVGAIYSLVYSIFLVIKHSRKFSLEFTKTLRMKRYLAIIPVVGILILLVFCCVLGFSGGYLLFSVLIAFITYFMYVYLHALDKCMIYYLPPEKLTEGDWIVEDVRFGKHLVKKTVHGLTAEDIKLLRKYHKKVLVKEGIPFVPAFLGSFILMVSFYAIL